MKKIILTGLFLCSFVAFTSIAGAHGGGPADANAMSNEKNADLIAAAKIGDVNKIKNLIESGADLNAKNKKKETALYIALENNHLEAATLLIEKGADRNAKNKDGLTPLMASALKNQAKAVRLLLERGANPNAENKKGKKILDLIKYDYPEKPSLRFLVSSEQSLYAKRFQKKNINKEK